MHELQVEVNLFEIITLTRIHYFTLTLTLSLSLDYIVVGVGAYHGIKKFLNTQ